MTLAQAHIQNCFEQGKHYEYLILVIFKGQQWAVRKRFSDFDRFDAALRSNGFFIKSHLPPKRSYTFPFIHPKEPPIQRQLDLQIYLNDMLSTLNVAEISLVREFLEVDGNMLAVALNHSKVEMKRSDRLRDVVQQFRICIMPIGGESFRHESKVSKCAYDKSLNRRWRSRSGSRINSIPSISTTEVSDDGASRPSSTMISYVQGSGKDSFIGRDPSARFRGIAERVSKENMVRCRTLLDEFSAVCDKHSWEAEVDNAYHDTLGLLDAVYPIEDMMIPFPSEKTTCKFSMSGRRERQNRGILKTKQLSEQESHVQPHRHILSGARMPEGAHLVRGGYGHIRHEESLCDDMNHHNIDSNSHKLQDVSGSKDARSGAVDALLSAYSSGDCENDQHKCSHFTSSTSVSFASVSTANLYANTPSVKVSRTPESQCQGCMVSSPSSSTRSPTFSGKTDPT